MSNLYLCMTENILMSTIDSIFSVFPVAESLFSAALLLWLFKSTHERHHLNLSVFFSILSLFYLMSVFFYSGVQNTIAVMFVLSLPVTLSILPAFYIYLISLGNRPKITLINKLLHYLPALLFFALLIPFWFVPVDIQHDFVTGTLPDISGNPLLTFVQGVYKAGVYVITNAQFAIYIVLIFIELRNYRHRIEDRFSFKEQINLEWMTYFILFFILLFTLINFSHFLGVSVYSISRMLFNVISSVIIFYLFIKGFIQRSAFVKVVLPSHAQEVLISESNDNVPLTETPKKQSDSKLKYSGSGLSETRKENLIAELNKIIASADVFGNPTLDIDELASLLQTNSSWLSQIINEHFGMNFFNFVNKIRIEEAKRLLADPANDKYTIEAIAGNCGFNSRSSFHSAFRKFEMTTPAEFRKKSRNNS